MVEKEREKDLGKVVTGGGEGTEAEGTEAEGTEKANHRGHGGHGENKPRRTRRRQTTEGTENTEIGREGADTLGGIYAARRVEVERAVMRATAPVLAADGVGTPVPFGIVWLCRRDRRHGKPGGLLHLAAAA